MTRPAALDPIRPFAWLAAAAFVAGFGGYLVLGQPQVAQTEATASPAIIAVPAVADDWNPMRRL